jgi:hypothetical protein
MFDLIQGKDVNFPVEKRIFIKKPDVKASHRVF